MSALTIQYVLLAIVAGLVLAVLLPPMIKTYLRFRGRRLVTCPETRRPAAVAVDAKYAAMSSAVEDRRPHLRLSECSRWPERQNCGQECLAQIEQSSEGCLIQSIIGQWYADKSCVLCGRLVGEFHWYEHRPALMSPEGVTLEWSSVAAEKVPGVLATHRPICWTCHIAETFRREHPELVTDRPPH